MQTEKTNSIIQILKHCPKDTPLWMVGHHGCPFRGQVYLLGFDFVSYGVRIRVSKDKRTYKESFRECGDWFIPWAHFAVTLQPSKNVSDWSKFQIPEHSEDDPFIKKNIEMIDDYITRRDRIPEVYENIADILKGCPVGSIFWLDNGYDSYPVAYVGQSYNNDPDVFSNSGRHDSISLNFCRPDGNISRLNKYGMYELNLPCGKKFHESQINDCLQRVIYPDAKNYDWSKFNPDNVYVGAKVKRYKTIKEWEIAAEAYTKLGRRFATPNQHTIVLFL